VNTGEEVGIDNVRGTAVDDRLLVAFGRIGLFGRDEGRSDVGEIGSGSLSRQHRTAVGDRAREDQRPVEPGADFLEQREWRPAARVPAGSCSDGDDPVGTFFHRFPRKAVVDHVMKRDPAPGMDRVVELHARTQ
jgi:hypothetical protein